MHIAKKSTVCLLVALLASGCAINRQPHPNQTALGGENTQPELRTTVPQGTAPTPSTGPSLGGNPNEPRVPLDNMPNQGGDVVTQNQPESAGVLTGGTPIVSDTMGGTPIGGGIGGRPSSGGGGGAAGGEPMGGAPVGGAPVGGAPVGGAPVGGAPVGGAPVGGEPMGGEPMGGEPMGGEPMGGGAVACAECISSQIGLTTDGGRVLWRATFRLRPCRKATYEIDRFQNRNPDTCTQEWGQCGEVRRLSISAIESAVAEPDVQDALAGDDDGRPKLYGIDNRPVDGVLDKLTVGNKSVLVGEACNGRMNMGGRPCTDPPAALTAAIGLLQQAQDEMRATPDCQAIIP